MSSLFASPKFLALDLAGNYLPGAQLYFTENLTSTPLAVYADRDLNTALSNPVIADAYGVFVPIWLQDAQYRVRLATAAGVTVWTVDEVGQTLDAQAVGLAIYPQTTSEAAAGITPTDYRFPPYDVRRYANCDATGTSDANAAFQAAVDALPAEGGTVTGEGDFRLDSAVEITGNRTFFDFKPGTTITVYSTDYGFHWQGPSAAAPGSYGGIKGARILAGNATATAAIYVQSFIFLRFEGVYGYGFYTDGGGGTRAFIKADYTFGTQFVANDIRWCDIGYHIGQDTGLAYRSTSLSWQGGKVGRCAKGVYLRDVYGFEMNGEFIIENCSLGLHLYGDKVNTGQTNCADGDIRGYFEGNGKHIYIQSNGSARSKGISIENAMFERLGNPATPFNNPYYSDGAALEVFGTGAACAYKVEIGGDNVLLGGNYWSGTAAVKDILIDAGVVGTIIGPQQRDFASIIDNGAETLYSVTTSVGVMPTADPTPSASGLSVCTITNATPITITALDNGHDGQVIKVRANDNNTTFRHATSGVGLRLWGGVNRTMAGGQMIEFTNYGSNIWVQTGFSHPLASAFSIAGGSNDYALNAAAPDLTDTTNVLRTLILALQSKGIV